MTPTLEHLMAAGIKRDVAERWLPHVQAALIRFNINTQNQVAAWLAQTAHESAGYTALTENLNYSADTMAVVWPTRFAEQEPDPKRPGKTRPKKDAKGKNIPNKFAQALHRKPEMIANAVYSATETTDAHLPRGQQRLLRDAGERGDDMAAGD